ncbi:MAG: CheY-like chemotaxis protein [Psychroserpens sp.]
MKIAVVDDNKKRSDEIKNLLIEECHISDDNIFQFHTTQAVKNTIRNMHFDIMFLDVIMPRRDETPNAKASFQLLIDLDSNSKLKKPETVIGITANTDDIEHYRKEFEKGCFTVIEATNSNPSWKQKIISAVSYKKSSSLSRGVSKSNIYCYTIHGIRSRGEWQQSLKGLIQQNADNVEFGTYKYGYFSLFAFILPFLRWPVVNRFSKDLEEVLEQNQDKRIILFSHSFGTYILVKALEKLVKKKKYENICTIVLAGSVLRQNYNFKLIQNQTNAKIVNDCGASDYILSLGEALVPNVGMAGKVGFKGTNNGLFVNRIFEGGHNHYFDNESKFMTTYWLPLLSENHELELVDKRKDSFVRLGLLDKSVSFLGALKEGVYILVITYLFYQYFFGA